MLEDQLAAACETEWENALLSAAHQLQACTALLPQARDHSIEILCMEKYRWLSRVLHVWVYLNLCFSYRLSLPHRFSPGGIYMK